MLFGRDRELDVFAGLTDRVRSGGSATLVVRGEPGVGKTALLREFAGQAQDFEVHRVEGVESELQLGYAGLHRIVLPFLERIELLPPPQRDAMRAAFGLSADGPSDRFLVGLATLTLLGDPERDAPLLIVVDDAHWVDLDSLAALAFVARRLQADRVALVFAVRDSVAHELPTQGLPELRVVGLPDDPAGDLLASLVSTTIHERVVTDVVAATQGNPLALTGLAEELTSSQLAGLSPLPDPLPAGDLIEARFARQIELLPASTQTALLIAAVEPTKDRAIIAAAAEKAGTSIQALEPAEALRLVRTDEGIEFVHPLIRSAVYSSASSADRRSAHGALASVLDAQAERDRWAMHRALAAVDPDEEVATALVQSATNARARGGYAAEAALLARAADLSPGSRERAQRVLGAAHAAYLAGNLVQARQLLEASRRADLDALETARAQMLDGTLGLLLGEGGRTPARLLEAALTLAPLDRTLSRQALLGAFNAMLSTYDNAVGLTGPQLAERTLRALEEGPGDPAVDSLLRAVASAYVLDRATTMDALRDAAATLERTPAAEINEWFYVGIFVPQEMWDPFGYQVVLDRLESSAREQGAITVLQVALLGLASKETREGRFTAARTRYAELIDITEAMGALTVLYVLLDIELLSWEGAEEEARAKIPQVMEAGETFCSGAVLQLGRYALMNLELSLGRYQEALAAARDAAAVDAPVWSWLVLPPLVEAATRCGDTQFASSALEEVEERAEAAETPFAVGMMWRCRALVWDDDRSKGAFESALEHLKTSPWQTEVARTHLLYGEWLRRQNMRGEARAQLRVAHELFESMGARIFAERARSELEATGERAKKRRVEATADLTPRELQIARLAADRFTSREIASQLFISPHTVEHHLKNVFQKLGVNSRRELAQAMPTRQGIQV